jgi:hypothetical protein
MGVSIPSKPRTELFGAGNGTRSGFKSRNTNVEAAQSGGLISSIEAFPVPQCLDSGRAAAACWQY